MEPTNNAAERALHHAVCWRKTSGGTDTITFTEDSPVKPQFQGQEIEALAGDKNLVINKALPPMPPRTASARQRAPAARSHTAAWRRTLDVADSKWARDRLPQFAQQTEELALLSLEGVPGVAEETQRALNFLEREHVSLTFAPGGRDLFAADRQGRLYSWDVELRPRDVKPVGHSVTDLVWGGGAERPFAIYTSPDLGVQSFPMTDANPRPTPLMEPRFGPQSAVALGRENRVAAGGPSGTVTVFRPGGAVEWTFGGTGGPVRALAFSPDDKWLGAATAGGAVTVWDLRTGRESLHTRLDGGVANTIAFSPSRAECAVGTGLTGNGAVHLIDLDARKVARRLALEGAGPATSVAYSPDGGSVIVGSRPALTPSVWNVDGGRKKLERGVKAFTISSEGNKIGWIYADESVKDVKGMKPAIVDLGKFIE